MSSLTTERHDSSPAEKTSAPVRKKATRLKVGTAIRVHSDVTSPDFPDPRTERSARSASDYACRSASRSSRTSSSASPGARF